MKHCGRILVCVLVGIALNAGAIVSFADGNGGPYRAIARRNIFGLLPPVNSHMETPAPVISRPKIKLVGITTLMGNKTAFLMLPTKPGVVRECSLLIEGEMREGIQVIDINEKKGIVKIVNHNEAQTLDFDHDRNEASDIPPRRLDGPEPSLPQEPVLPPEGALTPEQQMLVIESQRMKAQQDGDPIAKILPPTGFTPEITNEAP